MKENPQNTRLQETGCGVVTNLSTIKSNSEALLFMGAGERVIAAAKKHKRDEAVQAKAVCALRNLSWWSEKDVAFLVGLGAVEVVETAMKHFQRNRVIQGKGKDTLTKLKNA